MADKTQIYRSPPAGGSSREIEAWALTESALRMRAAANANDKDAILAAVRLNWRMWTFFQADMLGPECGLPDDLRGNLLSLAAFIDRHTVEVLASPQPAALDILISINRDLAMGLLENPAASAEVAQPADVSINLSA